MEIGAGDLVIELDAWIFGYTGTSTERRLRELLDRIPLQQNAARGATSAELRPRLVTSDIRVS
jgi:hypothetical protein